MLQYKPKVKKSHLKTSFLEAEFDENFDAY